MKDLPFRELQASKGPAHGCGLQAHQRTKVLKIRFLFSVIAPTLLLSAEVSGVLGTVQLTRERKLCWPVGFGKRGF